MLKIAYVISSCSSGGAELLVKRLCEMIADENIRIQLWVVCRAKDSVTDCPKEILDFEDSYISDLKKKSIEVLFLGKRKNKDRFKCCSNIRKYYKIFRPDIVHTHSELCTLYAAAALTGIKCRLIQTIHSSKITYPILIKRYLAYRISEFVSISDEVTKIMLNVGIQRRKITLIYNGVDLSKYTYPERKFDRKPVKLIAVGRLELEKDYPYLLEVFRQVLSRLEVLGIDFPVLDIIGSGSQKALVEELITRHNLGLNVHLLGLRQDIPMLLKSADIYVMSSIFEGLSLSLIEAASSGLPIIATDVGSNRQIIHPGANGFLIEYRDIELFAQAIVTLAQNSALREKYSHYSEKTAASFDIKKTAQQHLLMYQGYDQFSMERK